MSFKHEHGNQPGPSGINHPPTTVDALASGSSQKPHPSQGNAHINTGSVLERNDQEGDISMRELTRKETTVALLTEGTNMNVSIKEGGDSALIAAARSGQTEMATALNNYEGTDMNVDNTQGDTALIIAIRQGQTEITLALINAGADVNIVNKQGDTALITATRKGQTKIAIALINGGADMDVANTQGDTALIQASYFGHTEIAVVLINGGADINFANTQGDTALITATRQGHTEIALALINGGADVNVINKQGDTALIIATRKGHTEIAFALITAGTDINIVYSKGSQDPVTIQWISHSLKHKAKLAAVVRKQEMETIGSYWYHQKHIGRGSFGHVFAGISEKDGREVAIKKIERLRMIRPEDKREITNLTALADCHQVVRYIYFDDSDKDFVFIVLELMEGHLDDYFASSAFDVKKSTLLCKDIAMGLKYLHQHQPNPILHRDLKPGNILYKLYPELCLKIGDFGLSSPLTTGGSTVRGTDVGTRCWMAPEVFSSNTCQHSLSSDVFSCGLLLHYILSVQKHPFSPADCTSKSNVFIDHKIQENMLNGKMEGWDSSLGPEASHLIKDMLQSDETKRQSAADSLVHPMFWSNKKKMDLLSAVGNQQEFECPRAKRTPPLSHVETDLESTFPMIVNYATWNDPRYNHMPGIYAEMTGKKGRKYDTGSVVELVRFIRNSIAHVSEASRPPLIRKQILEDAVFLDYFPHLVIEVFKAVTKHGWDAREEIKNILAN